MKRLFLFSILLAGVIVTVSACDKNDDYNPSLITESLKSFINTSYNDARIVGTDYERGLLKIEIIHEKKEKDLYFENGQWQYTEWDDYNIPQLYWEIGHKAADYDTLIRWWAKHSSARPLFIGQDIHRTVKFADLKNPLQHQLPAKMKLQRSLPTVQGSCQWYSAAILENPGNYSTLLEKDYHRYPALIPTSPFMDDKAPGKVKKLKMVWTYEGPVLFWTAPKAKDEMDRAIQYVVYRFENKEKVNLNDPSKIVGITRDTFIHLPYEDGKVKYQYVVTALDRLHNESKAAKIKVKL